MTEKRFIDDGFEAIEDQSFTDTETDKTYYVDYFDEIIDLANGLTAKNKVLYKEIERLKIQNKDLLYSNAKNMELLEKENKQLKKNRFICLGCEHSGYVEIGCLCEKKDHWTDYKTECEDYERLE